MSTQPSVEGILASLRRRQRVLNALRWCAHGLVIGLALGCVAAAIVWSAASIGAIRLGAVALACAAAGAVIAAIAGLIAPVSDLSLARALDRAAASEDRFASALQLADHHRRARAQLVVEDAIGRVRGTEPGAVLPVRLPRSLRWLPVPVLLLAALLVFLPQAVPQASAATEPEISAEDWRTLHDEFKKDLAQLPKPQTAEEQELQRKLEELAALLKERPDKREALKEIARLSDKVQQQRRALGSRGVSMKSAARAVASSQSLRQFAARMQEGAYKSAAGELRKLSEQLKKNQLTPDAKEFESLSSDLQRLAEQIAAEQEIQGECQKCSSAAGSMNKDALAEALRRLAEQMERQSDRLSQCDKLGQCSDMLEQLKRMMNQCQGGKPGDGFCQNPGGGGKGGLKAGWGSAAKWTGGSIDKRAEQRTPDVASAQDRPGMSTSFQVVSPDERAASGRKYEELYAEFVQKSEADLDLESVPAGYRDYLKRYFNSIRPKEAAPAETPEKSP